MMEFIPIQIDKSHLSTIGERLYTQSLDLIRELVANAYDADATVVRISVDGSTITVEDNGIGMNKDGIKQYLTIGSNFKKQNPLSPTLKRVRIGEFGIGKFAVLSICDRFEVYTKSADYSATLLFNRYDFETRNDWNIPLVEHEGQGEGTGTRVSLFEIKKSILLLEIERHLIHIFPLNDPHFSLYLNGNKLSSKFIPGERFKVKEHTRFGEIKGEIILSSLMLTREQIGIGIRVKGIVIKRETFHIEVSHELSVKRLTGESTLIFYPLPHRGMSLLQTAKSTKNLKRLWKRNCAKLSNQ